MTDLLVRAIKNKVFEIITEINKNPGRTQANVASQTKITYAHTCLILKQLEKKGIVNITKKGRSRIVELSGKGYDLYHHLTKVGQLCY